MQSSFRRRFRPLGRHRSRGPCCLACGGWVRSVMACGLVSPRRDRTRRGSGEVGPRGGTERPQETEDETRGEGETGKPLRIFGIHFSCLLPFPRAPSPGYSCLPGPLAPTPPHPARAVGPDRNGIPLASPNPRARPSTASRRAPRSPSGGRGGSWRPRRASRGVFRGRASTSSPSRPRASRET